MSSETPTSAPENSFNTAETASAFYSSSDTKDDKNASFVEVASAESSSHSKVATADVDQTSTKVPNISFSKSNADGFSTVSSMSSNTADYTYDMTQEKVSHDASHSDTFKPELNNDVSITQATRNMEKSLSNANTGEKEQSTNASENNTEKKATAETTVTQPDNATSPGYVSIYSGQSSVPSREEIVYNSSHLDKNLSPEDMTSSAPIKVQSDERENNDTKSSTHKRSLNATNSVGSSTTSSNNTNSATAHSASSSHDSTPSKLTEREDEEYFSSYLISTEDSISASNVNHAAIENGGSVGMIHDVLKDEEAGSTYSINSDNPNVGVSGGHIVNLGSLVPESSSSAYLKDASLSSLSLDALSIVNEESIHPSGRFESAAQIANTRHMSTMTSVNLKSPDLEVEYEESPASLVTFDPDGMTHNSSQEPDSITFTPRIVHGKPTSSSYSSNLEHEELHNNKPELLPENLSTAFVTDVVGSSSHNMEGLYSSERERETPSANQGLSPHDEPDREAPTSIHTFVSTKIPEEISSTYEAETAEKSKTISEKNDESEEMLNDSPHFTQNENKPVVMPTGEFTNKYLNKDLENNISNDIAHAPDSKSQNLRELHHELDFPIEYQTQQSEIRPVTAVSPIKTSETVTDLPISLDLESQSSANETKSDHPVSIPIDRSSPMILPNPAPSIVNKSSEKLIVVSVSPEMLPKDYVSPDLLPKDYVPPELLPKDFVPPELLPKDYTTPKTLATDHISSKIIPIDNIPPELLPKDYVPSEMPPKDSLPSEMLPKDYVSPDKLPEIHVPSEKPSKDIVKSAMLPKDDISPDLLPKDYVPPEMLPKEYTTEGGNNTDTNVNTTIAGVAVKTSVSVSLPLSKFPNNTTGTPENSEKQPSNMTSKNNDAASTLIPTNKGKL